MKVVLLTLDFPPDVGGVQRYLYEIARRLPRDYDLTVVTPVEGEDADVPFRRLVLPPQRLDLWLKAVRGLRPQWVLVGHAHPRLLLVAALTAPRYLVFTYGNDFLAAQSRWHRPLFNALLRRATYAVALSQAGAARLRDLGLSRIHIVYPGTDPERFTPPPQPPPPPWTLLSVGRLVPRKGMDTVIRALPRLPGVRYRIAGTGPDEARLRALAEDMRVADRVDFLGRVPEARLPQVYREAHLFVLPTREEAGGRSVEGFGIVYLEAAASALPLVVSHAAGVAEHLRRHDIGRIVPPDAPDILAQTVDHLLGDAALRRRLGRAARAWVEREMRWEHAAARVAALLSGDGTPSPQTFAIGGR